MKEVIFYQLKSSGDQFERTACQILEKCYKSGKQTLAKCSGQEQLENINRLLWTFSQKSFIPHGTIHDPHPEVQPIFITVDEENLNNSSILALIDCDFSNVSSFERVIVIFSDLNKNSAALAQKQYDSFKKIYDVTIYSQSDKGSWEKLSDLQI